MSIMVGVGKGAGAGVLIKSAEALERMEKVDTLVVDKTGTLTEGKPRVVAVVPGEGMSEHEILPLAASLERSSEHPLAAAIVAAARSAISRIAEPERSTPSPARASSARSATAGGTRQCEADDRSRDRARGSRGRAPRLRGDGATALYLAIDGKPAGVIAIADPIKPTTQEALRTLRADGVRIVMLTGDNRTTAEAVARKLGIDDVQADVLPEDKTASSPTARRRPRGRHGWRWCQRRPGVGRADVGIAMGTGTEVAIQSAGITLVKGDLAGIARARRSAEPPCATSGRTCCSPSSTTRSAFRSPPACSIRRSVYCSSPRRRARHGAEFGLGDRQRFASSSGPCVSSRFAAAVLRGVQAKSGLVLRLGHLTRITHRYLCGVRWQGGEPQECC